MRTIIGLAQSLSLTVTAEGAETIGQVKALRDLGCTNAQGYYFSRPVEATLTAAIVANGSDAFVIRPSEGIGFKVMSETLAPIEAPRSFAQR